MQRPSRPAPPTRHQHGRRRTGGTGRRQSGSAQHFLRNRVRRLYRGETTDAHIRVSINDLVEEAVTATGRPDRHTDCA